MTNLKSELFQSLKLNEKEAQNVVGGAYTSALTDTNMSGGSTDMTFRTDGKVGSDNIITSPVGDTRDKPINMGSNVISPGR